MIDVGMDILGLEAGDIYLDCTLGGAGHAIEAAGRVGPCGTVIGLDIDSDAIEAAKQRMATADCEVMIEKSSYVCLDNVLEKLRVPGIDAALFDLGVSSFQLDRTERGFTYREDAPLDMRMDRFAGRTAEDIVNAADEAQLIRILSDFGEEKWSVRLAKFIIDARQKDRIRTASQLIRIVEAAIPKGAREIGQHPARRTFQALRIAVNTELENISAGIPKAIEALNPGGRIAVISYHSLEDRIVKNILKKSEKPCICPPDIPVCACGLRPSTMTITRKPVVASEEEVKRNPRSRSAKLRAAEKIA